MSRDKSEEVITLGISIAMNNNLVSRWSSDPKLTQAGNTKAIKTVR